MVNIGKIPIIICIIVLLSGRVKSHSYCGSCYDGTSSCCNSCDDVKTAYKMRDWFFLPSLFSQCTGFSSPPSKAPTSKISGGYLVAQKYVNNWCEKGTCCLGDNKAEVASISFNHCHKLHSLPFWTIPFQADSLSFEFPYVMYSNFSNYTIAGSDENFTFTVTSFSDHNCQNQTYTELLNISGSQCLKRIRVESGTIVLLTILLYCTFNITCTIPVIVLVLPHSVLYK